jgi:tryptophanyl-tRNA synthetase
MTRVFSGIQPTGEMHLGNYLGAVRNWVVDQHEHDSFYCVVDLHALTLPQDPATLQRKIREMYLLLISAGLDPDVCTLFVQSHVHEHAELGWIMTCTVSIGELQRMTQFKDKAAKQGGDFISAGLLTYPALQAADIILYDADRVPVGDDQRQHIEITRDMAQRFNSRFGDTFVLPEVATPRTGARVMDLQEPTRKMSKSSDSPQGTIGVLDEAKDIERKVKRAVTDADGEVRFDSLAKPGVSNLLSILAAATATTPEKAGGSYTQYGPLKSDTAAAVIEMLRPVQVRFAEFMADPAEADRLIRAGAEKAQVVAASTMVRVKAALGITAP